MTAGCRLGRRRSRRRAPNSAAPSTSRPLIGRQFEVSALSGGSVGRLCGSGGRVWSGDRPPVLVCVFYGRLCVLGIRILSITGNRNLGVSALPRVWWSVCGCVCACLSTRLLCRVPPLVRSRSLSFDLDLARGIEVNRRCLVRTRPWRYARAAAARSALFGVFGVCGCGVF